MIWVVFLTSGIITGKSLRTHLNANLLPIIICLTFFISIVIFLIYKKKKSGSLSIRILLIVASINFLAIGFCCSYFYYYREDKNIFQNLYDYRFKNPDASIIVEGRISSYPEIKKGYLLFILCSQKITIQNADRVQDLKMESGDVINVKLKTSNYYSFERDDFIKAKGALNLQDDRLMLVLEDFHTEKIPAKGLMSFFYNLRKRTYECISRVYYNKLGTCCDGIAEAFVLGNSNFISSHILESFKHSGVYHLLAISGLHISFFIYLLVSFLKFAGPGSIKSHLKNI